MTPQERLAVGIIRAMNGRVLPDGATDQQVLARHGAAAMPWATALHAVVRDEVRRQLGEGEHDKAHE